MSTDANNRQSAILEEYFYDTLAAAVLDPQFEQVITNIAVQDMRSRNIPVSHEAASQLPDYSTKFAISDVAQRSFANTFMSALRNPSFSYAVRSIARSEEACEPGSNGSRETRSGTGKESHTGNVGKAKHTSVSEESGSNGSR